MVKVMCACSPVFLAATLAAAVVDGQTPAPAAQAAQPQTVTVVGCVTRNGVVDVDKGVRRLNMDPDGLALTAARIVNGTTQRPSAVPGSQPDDSNTGTIPRGTIVGGRAEDPDTAAFALTGDPVKTLGDHVGRRVEVIGRITSAPSAPQSRGTGGDARDAAPVPGVGTREERPGEGSAHPSTELPKLDVVSFRSATGACQ